MKKSISEFVKKKRLEQGLSLTVMANQFGKGPSWVSEIERGAINIRGIHLKKFGEVLKLNLKEQQTLRELIYISKLPNDIREKYIPRLY